MSIHTKHIKQSKEYDFAHAQNTKAVTYACFLLLQGKVSTLSCANVLLYHLEKTTIIIDLQYIYKLLLAV